jgi:hypothetical protein
LQERCQCYLKDESADFAVKWNSGFSAKASEEGANSTISADAAKSMANKAVPSNERKVIFDSFFKPSSSLLQILFFHAQKGFAYSYLFLSSNTTLAASTTKSAMVLSSKITAAVAAIGND